MLNILVIEPLEEDGVSLCSYLEQMGHTPHQADSVAAALDSTSLWDSRIVFLSPYISDVPASEFIRQFREGAPSGYNYFMLVTSGALDVDVAAIGADDYLARPVGPAELRARIAVGERLLNLERVLNEAKENLSGLAMHDSLTGLFTRRAIYERALAELNRCGRRGTPLSLVLVDIDHLKDINESHGQVIGDQALRYVADVIASTIRSYDLAGRWGGEEFLIVMPEASIGEAARAAERLRRQIAESRLPLTRGDVLRLTVSLGVNEVHPRNPADLDVFLCQVDDALFQAKREGRNRVYWFRDS